MIRLCGIQYSSLYIEILECDHSIMLLGTGSFEFDVFLWTLYFVYLYGIVWHICTIVHNILSRYNIQNIVHFVQYTNKLNVCKPNDIWHATWNSFNINRGTTYTYINIQKHYTIYINIYWLYKLLWSHTFNLIKYFCKITRFLYIFKYWQ